MKTGFARRSIVHVSTAERCEIHDALCVTAMAIAQSTGEPAGLLLSVDLTNVPVHLIDAFRKRLADDLDLSPGSILIHLTHTHSAPRLIQVDREKLYQAFAAAARDAFASTVEVRISHVSKPAVEGMTVCRRWHSETELGTFSILDNERCRVERGKVHVKAHIEAQLKGMAVTDIPEIPDAILDPPADSELSLTRFADGGGNVIGGIVRFAAHVDQMCLRDGRVFSTEYPGALRRELEDRLGGTFLFLNGPCGDIKLVYEGHTWEQCERVGKRLADEAVRLLDEAPSFKPLGSVAFLTDRFPVPTRKDVPKDPFELCNEMWRLRWDLKCRLASGTTCLEMKSWDSHRWAVDTLTYFAFTDRESGEHVGLSEWPFNITLVDFDGKTQLLGIQEEVFGEFTRTVRARHPELKNLQTVGICNGGDWYLMPAYEIERGGYEPTCSIFAPGAFEKVVERATGLLRTLRRREKG